MPKSGTRLPPKFESSKSQKPRSITCCQEAYFGHPPVNAPQYYIRNTQTNCYTPAQMSAIIVFFIAEKTKLIPQHCGSAFTSRIPQKHNMQLQCLNSSTEVKTNTTRLFFFQIFRTSGFLKDQNIISFRRQTPRCDD